MTRDTSKLGAPSLLHKKTRTKERGACTRRDRLVRAMLGSTGRVICDAESFSLVKHEISAEITQLTQVNIQRLLAGVGALHPSHRRAPV